MAKGKVVSMYDSPEKAIRERARNLPIYKCLISEDWQDSKLPTVVVSRKHVNGNITLGLYMIDLLCQGVVESAYMFNEPEEGLFEGIQKKGEETFIEVDYNLAHNVIYASIEFADNFELRPSKVFDKVTKYILEEDTDDIPLIEIECGEDGVPIVFTSADAPNKKLIAQLDAIVGPDNYLIVDLDEDDVDEESDKPKLDLNEIYDSNYESYMEQIKKEFPNFKELHEWGLKEFENFFKSEDKYPPFQVHEVIDRLYIQINPEFDYVLDELPEYSEFLNVEIDDSIFENTYNQNPEIVDYYLDIKATSQDKSKDVENLIKEALAKFPNSEMIAHAKLSYLIDIKSNKVESYISDLLSQYTDSLIIKNSAIGYYLFQEKMDIAEKLINGCFHPNQHSEKTAFTSIDLVGFYSCIAKYFLLKNDLLKADIYLTLAEESIDCSPRILEDFQYNDSRDCLTNEKLKKIDKTFSK